MSSIFGKVNIPAGRFGEVIVERFVLDRSSRSAYNLFGHEAPDGEYTRLSTYEEWMTDTPTDLITQETAYRHAHGRVLTMGLGLGSILPAILAKDGVESVTVLERSPDVIAYVGPHYTHPKLTIIQGDGMTWEPPNGTTFNTIWLDFLQPLEVETLPAIDALVARYAQWLDGTDPEAWCDHWLAEELRANRDSWLYG